MRRIGTTGRAGVGRRVPDATGWGAVSDVSASSRAAAAAAATTATATATATGDCDCDCGGPIRRLRREPLPPPGGGWPFCQVPPYEGPSTNPSPARRAHPAIRARRSRRRLRLSPWWCAAGGSAWWASAGWHEGWRQRRRQVLGLQCCCPAGAGHGRPGLQSQLEMGSAGLSVGPPRRAPRRAARAAGHLVGRAVVGPLGAACARRHAGAGLALRLRGGGASRGDGLLGSCVAVGRPATGQRPIWAGPEPVGKLAGVGGARERAPGADGPVACLPPCVVSGPGRRQRLREAAGGPAGRPRLAGASASSMQSHQDAPGREGCLRQRRRCHPSFERARCSSASPLHLHLHLHLRLRRRHRHRHRLGSWPRRLASPPDRAPVPPTEAAHVGVKAPWVTWRDGGLGGGAVRLAAARGGVWPHRSLQAGASWPRGSPPGPCPGRRRRLVGGWARHGRDVRGNKPRTARPPGGTVRRLSTAAWGWPHARPTRRICPLLALAPRGRASVGGQQGAGGIRRVTAPRFQPAPKTRRAAPPCRAGRRPRDGDGTDASLPEGVNPPPASGPLGCIGRAWEADQRTAPARDRRWLFWVRSATSLPRPTQGCGSRNCGCWPRARARSSGCGLPCCWPTQDSPARHGVNRPSPWLRQTVPDGTAQGLLLALSLGSCRQAVGPSGLAVLVRPWPQPRRGKISGLHIQVWAWISAAACSVLWRRSSRACAWCPAPLVGPGRALPAPCVRVAVGLGPARPAHRAHDGPAGDLPDRGWA